MQPKNHFRRPLPACPQRNSQDAKAITEEGGGAACPLQHVTHLKHIASVVGEVVDGHTEVGAQRWGSREGAQQAQAGETVGKLGQMIMMLIRVITVTTDGHHHVW